jgi:hypothetical protein
LIEKVGSWLENKGYVGKAKKIARRSENKHVVVPESFEYRVDFPQSNNGIFRKNKLKRARGIFFLKTKNQSGPSWLLNQKSTHRTGPCFKWSGAKYQKT